MSPRLPDDREFRSLPTRPSSLSPLARIAAAERETTFCWDEQDRTVVVWSCSGPVLRKLMKLGFRPTRESRSRDGRLHGMQFAIPLERFRWGLKRRAAQKRPVVCPGPPVDAIPGTQQAADGSRPAPTTEAA
jgi:hypothetical protein